MSAAAPAPNSDAIREQLARILRGKAFRSSPRMTEFLRFVVESPLDNPSLALKESTVAVEVFARPVDFDARIDTIVRVQAVRLRTKLLEYYATEGAGDPLRIELPPGGYTPKFLDQRPASSAPPPLADPAAGKGIAVLPFIDLSAQKDQEYFCDGIAEQVLHLISRAGELRVVARTSSFAFKNRLEDVRKIGQALSVEYILEGSIRKYGDRIRLTAQMLDAKTGFQLWSETWDRQLTDVFAVQDELAGAITSRLLGRQLEVVKQPRAAMSAYEYCLVARHHFNRQTALDFVRSREMFEEAIQIDGNYAPAWAGLAVTWSYCGFFGLGTPLEILSEVQKAALRALEIDPELPEGLVAMGYVASYKDLDPQFALEMCHRALRLRPNSAMACDWLSFTYRCWGKLDRALEYSRRALALDPYSAGTAENHAFCHFLARDFEESLRLYQRLSERDPSYALGWLGIAWNRIAMGCPVEAIEFAEKARKLWGDHHFVLGTLGLANGLAGRRKAARECLAVLESAAKNGYVDSFEFALVHLGLGHADAAAGRFRQAYEERAGFVLYVPIHPLLDPLRSHPEFQAVVAELKRHAG